MAKDKKRKMSNIALMRDSIKRMNELDHKILSIEGKLKAIEEKLTETVVDVCELKDMGQTYRGSSAIIGVNVGEIKGTEKDSNTKSQVD